jgi:carbonic anhydrase
MIRIASALIATLLSCMTVTTFAAVNDASVKIKWGYKGNIAPTRWGQLDPQFAMCATGKEQSPINITKKVTKTVNGLKINYTNSPMTIVEDGVTDLQLGHQHTVILDGHSIQLNFSAETAKEIVTFRNTSYRLIQFHIHTPSETQLHGQSFPLEIHFVHQGEEGKLLVLAVLVKAGKENAVLKKIADHLPKEIGEEYTIPGEVVNPVDLLPAKRHRYYTYAGSLTTPPCTEGVEWVVFADSVTASPAQIQMLRKAVDGANARPQQPLNDRVITYSTEKT